MLLCNETSYDAEAGRRVGGPAGRRQAGRSVAVGTKMSVSIKSRARDGQSAVIHHAGAAA